MNHETTVTSFDLVEYDTASNQIKTLVPTLFVADGAAVVDISSLNNNTGDFYWSDGGRKSFLTARFLCVLCQRS